MNRIYALECPVHFLSEKRSKLYEQYYLACISYFLVAPDHTWLAANVRSAIDVAKATPPSAQTFSLSQLQSVINQIVRFVCLGASQLKNVLGAKNDLQRRALHGLERRGA